MPNSRKTPKGPPKRKREHRRAAKDAQMRINYYLCPKATFPRVNPTINHEYNECKPIPIYDIDDSPIPLEVTTPVKRIRPPVDNNVYVVPDSDDEIEVNVDDNETEVYLPEEKRQQIQEYINLIPTYKDSKCVDFIKINRNRLVKSPEATEEEIQRIIEKHSKIHLKIKHLPETNVLERIDYCDDGASVHSRTPVSIKQREPVPSTSKSCTVEEEPNIPETSEHKFQRERDVEVMEYVNEIVGEFSDNISREVKERYERIWNQEDESKRLRMEAEINNFVELDDSVEIIEPPDVEVVEVAKPEKNQPVSVSPEDIKKGQTEKVCPICLETLSGGVELSATFCGHVFCSDCIKAAIKQNHRCPTCRTKLTLKKVIPLFL